VNSPVSGSCRLTFEQSYTPSPQPQITSQKNQVHNLDRICCQMKNVDNYDGREGGGWCKDVKGRVKSVICDDKRES
jgi:hypothetical protein